MKKKFFDISVDENTIPGIKTAIKAFMAGAILPAIGVPVIYGILWYIPSLHYVLPIPFYVVPIIWGMWNVLYIWLRDDVTAPWFRRGLWGAILGLILATIAIFIFRVPMLIGIPFPWYYLVFILAPVAYFIIWEYVINFLNSV